jgi:TolB-like protein/DNA-binding winged helix-turn-helix (wHTH) protein/tetratricopeptide (TPR) repeat protein
MPEGKHFYEFGPFRLDPAERLLLRSNQTIPLAPKAFDTLLLLVENSGHLLTKEELMRRLWPETFVEEVNLAQNISAIRRALDEKNGGEQYIETVPKGGYRFVGQVSVSQRVAPTTVPAQQSAATPGPQSHPVSTKGLRRRFVLGVAVVIALAVLAWGIGRLRVRAGESLYPIHSIAILPLQNLSNDPQQEYFVDGMTDELITDLAKMGKLRVISRTSVMSYKGTHKSLGTIAGELNVDAVVEGTVLRSGNRVRVTAQLLGASPERHLWADSYQGDLTDVFSLQDRVARSIAREIRVTLTPEEQTRLMNLRPADPEAYDAYVRGRHYASQITPEGFEKAVVNFSRAIELQPRYAQAYADLAETYCWAAATQATPAQEGLLKARQAAMKALEIDERLSQAHSSLAWVKYVYEWNFLEAEREFHRSLELHPSTSWPPLWYGMYLAQGNRIEESIAEMKKVQQLDPLSPVANALALTPMLTGRRYDVAIEGGRKLLDTDRQNVLARWILTSAYEWKGDFPKAIELQEETAVLYGENKEAAARRFSRLRLAYQTLGAKGYWSVNLEQRQSLWKTNPGDPYTHAVLYARVDKNLDAFNWLEKAYQVRSQELVLGVRTEPAFDGLRSDPRYVDLVHRIGFPQQTQ